MTDQSKIPPQAIDFEEALLGELIMEPRLMDQVASILSPEDFYKEPHQKIYTAIYELWQHSRQIDILTVTDELRKKNILDHVGGPYYITKLTSTIGLVTIQSATSHAMTIKDRAVKRQFIQFGSELQSMAYNEGSDIEDLLNSSNSGMNGITDTIYKVQPKATLKDFIEQSLDAYYVRKQNKGESVGIRTPILKLTKITGGWLPGLIIVAGRPSMGKTALAVQCAVTAAEQGKFIDFYTIEMTGVQLTQRVMACKANIDSERYRNGQLTDQEEQELEASVDLLTSLNINIDDASGISADYIKAKSSANYRRKRCDMIVVDYLQLMAYDNKLNRNEGVGTITRRLKALSKELNIPIILLSQLSRGTEAKGGSRIPGLSHLRDSGEIEQDADIVIFPFRPNYYDDNEPFGLMQIIIAKHRDGRTGMVEARHNESISRIYDPEPEEYENYQHNETVPF